MVMNPVAVVQRENARLQNENEHLQAELNSLREFVQVLNDLAERAKVATNDEALMPML